MPSRDAPVLVSETRPQSKGGKLLLLPGGCFAYGVVIPLPGYYARRTVRLPHCPWLPWVFRVRSLCRRGRRMPPGPVRAGLLLLQGTKSLDEGGQRLGDNAPAPANLHRFKLTLHDEDVSVGAADAQTASGLIDREQ